MKKAIKLDWESEEPWISIWGVLTDMMEEQLTVPETVSEIRDLTRLDYKCPHLHLDDLQAFLPLFIDDCFSTAKDKRAAIFFVSHFLDWMKKNVKTKLKKPYEKLSDCTSKVGVK